jgi:hypothetical protein
MAFLVSNLCNEAFIVYTLTRGCDAMSYDAARHFAEQFDIEISFFGSYGLPSQWVDENGNPFGIDVGEFILWLQRVMIEKRR